MYNITRLDEARALLAKDELSPAEVQDVLLYLLHRDEAFRQTYGQGSAVLTTLCKLFPPLLPGVSRTTTAQDEEIARQMQEAVQALLGIEHQWNRCGAGP
jgi:hypothetical protein